MLWLLGLHGSYEGYGVFMSGAGLVEVGDYDQVLEADYP